MVFSEADTEGRDDGCGGVAEVVNVVTYRVCGGRYNGSGAGLRKMIKRI